MSFTQWLADESKIILFDGAMGTQLMQYDLEPGKTPDLLNIENPEIVQKVLASYYDSGRTKPSIRTFGCKFFQIQYRRIISIRSYF